MKKITAKTSAPINAYHHFNLDFSLGKIVVEMEIGVNDVLVLSVMVCWVEAVKV